MPLPKPKRLDRFLFVFDIHKTAKSVCCLSLDAAVIIISYLGLFFYAVQLNFDANDLFYFLYSFYNCIAYIILIKGRANKNIVDLKIAYRLLTFKFLFISTCIMISTVFLLEACAKYRHFFKFLVYILEFALFLLLILAFEFQVIWIIYSYYRLLEGEHEHRKDLEEVDKLLNCKEAGYSSLNRSYDSLT